MKGVIYYVTIAMVIFLLVKISCFHVKAHLVNYISVYTIYYFIFYMLLYNFFFWEDNGTFWTPTFQILAESLAVMQPSLSYFEKTFRDSSNT